MMLAAAQAAAEAALRDSSERDSHSSEASATLNSRAIDASVASLVQARGRVIIDRGKLVGAEFGLSEQAEGFRAGDAENMQSLLQMVTQQEHQQLAAAAAAISSRPDFHYLTVARNGTILGATETITGFPPNALLMKLIYDCMYDEDIPGFLAVKTQFWDKGRPAVGGFHRRRTLEGNWLWVSTKVASYIEQPVPGFVFLETRVRDERLALRINRITRISSILMQTLGATNDEDVSPGIRNERKCDGVSSDSLPWFEDDLAGNPGYKYRATPAKSKLGLADETNPLARLQGENDTNVPNADEDRDYGSQGLTSGISLFGSDSSGRESFDPLSTIEGVRSGRCLDMGMIRLFLDEVKIVTLVLTGQLPIEDLPELVVAAVDCQGGGLVQGLDGYRTDLEEAIHNSDHSDRGKSCWRGESGRTEKHPQNFVSRIAENQLKSTVRSAPPPLSVVNLSYSYMGNTGLAMLSEIIYVENSMLKAIDISFCGVDEKGILALCRAISERRRKGLPPLQGVVLSGNYISYRAAKYLGIALSSEGSKRSSQGKTRPFAADSGDRFEGDSDDNEFVNDCEVGDSSIGVGVKQESRRTLQATSIPQRCCQKGTGLQILHIGSTSLSAAALYQLLLGLGQHCPIRELSIPSNNIGPTGATLLVDFLEGKGTTKNHPVMPFLDRLDLSNNNLGNDGTAKLTRAISKRIKVNLVDLRLSSNEIGAGGIETIMNKLLQHNLISLSLDKNTIGDQGCQLVAASLPSMHQLTRLNLSFNQIGSRGVNTLMRTLVGCESIRHLGLSGNIMKISGAIAMGFTLAQHPRLEELDLDNCCLSQAAQCHVVAGMISNRWVPMKRMNGFQVGPPMVAIGALDVRAQHLSNDECFRLRRDEQMKTILQWMQSNRAAKLNGRKIIDVCESQPDSEQNFLTPDFVSSMNDVHGAPSQSAYLRMLGWLSQIPFDEEELTSLRKYFYDVDGGEGDRGSDGYINLKLRGDLLAALSSDVAEQIRDAHPAFQTMVEGSVGLDINEHGTAESFELGNSLQRMQRMSSGDLMAHTKGESCDSAGIRRSSPVTPAIQNPDASDGSTTCILRSDVDGRGSSRKDLVMALQRSSSGISSTSVSSKQSLPRHESGSHRAKEDRRNFNNVLKPRISVFSAFEVKLEELKSTAQEMMDQEDDPGQQDVILTQYAEASLTILRQLRYHCMNSGLDGWRQGGLRRKVLIVDDSKVTRKMVSRAFEKANFIVDTAENGVEGVEKLKESIYDIVFMDIDMPVMNGFEATKELRQWEDAMRPGARQPICALTAAYVDDFERSELMKFKEAGLDVMESKPCNIPRLFKVVDDVSPMFSDLSISVTQQESSAIPC